MKKIHIVLVLLLGALLAPHAALAAEGLSVRGILIHASNEKRPPDPRLKPYEAELQRNLVFSSFQYAGEGVTKVAGGGRSTVNLAKGHRLELESDTSGGSGIVLKVQWLNGSTLLISTSLTLQRGIPAVLVNRQGDDADAVIVIAR